MSIDVNTLGSTQALELCPGLALLKEEHVPLLAKIDSILLETEQINKEEDSLKNFADLKNQVEAFKVELEPHSRREEEALFQLLAAYMDPASGPIAVNTGEHKQAADLLCAFLEKAGKDSLTLTEIKEATVGIISAANLLKKHFSKEENILFPKAESLLSDEEKKELYRRIQENK